MKRSNTSKYPFEQIATMLRENAESIENDATNKHIAFIGADKLRFTTLIKLKKDHMQSIKDIAKYLDNESIEAGIKFFNEIGVKLAKKSINAGMTLEEAVNGSIFLKQAIWRHIEETKLLEKINKEDLFHLNQLISTYVDVLSTQIAFAYHESYTEQLKKEANNAEIIHNQIEELMKQHQDERNRLEFGQKAGSIGTYEWNLITGKSIWTKEFEALYGYPDGGFKSDNAETWLKYLHPDDRKRVMEQTQKAIEKGDTLHTEYRVIWPDKTTHFLANRAEIIRDKRKKTIKMIGVNIDITKRKHIENNLMYLSEASKALASSLDYKTTLATVAKLAVPTIADWCTVAMKSAEKIETLAVAHIDPKKVKWALELSKTNPPNPNAKTGLPNVLRTGKSELYPDVNEEVIIKSARSKEEVALIRKLQMSSVMIVPFLLHGKAIGAISFVAAESGRHYSQADLAMAEEVASRMILAIDNARLFTEAKAADEAQKRLVAIVESSDDAIIGLSTEGIITNWNKGAQRLYGYTPEDVIGKPTSMLMPPEREDDFPKIMKQLREGKMIEHYESKRKTKDGRIIDVSLTMSPIRNNEGKIIGASKVARDITAKKRAEVF